MQTEQELFIEYPKILEIARRLENSESKAVKETELYRAKGKDTEKHPDHFQFNAYYIEGTRYSLDLGLQSGKADFLETIKWIMEAHEPDAIALTLHNGKPSRRFTGRKIVIAITEAGEGINENVPAGEALQGTGKVQRSGIERAENTDFKIQLMQKDYDYRLEKIDLEKKHDKALAEKLEEIKDLKAAIKSYENEIAQLKEQLDEQDGALGTLNEQIDRQQDPPVVDVISKVAQRAITGVLQTQPKLASAITGLTEDELKGIWLKETPQLESPPTVNAGASFDENASEEGFEGKSEEHIHAIKTIYRFCKQIPLEAFKKLITIFTSVSNDAGDLDHVQADKLIAYIYQLQQEEKKQAEQILTNS